MMDWMMQASHWIARVMDYVLGWMLSLPHRFGLPEDASRDVAIVLVAVGTSIILTYARKWTTNQELMGRCKRDMDRLKELKREARLDHDKDAKKRIITSIGTIQLMKLKSEGWGLVASLLPILLLACWAFDRLDYFAPQTGEVVTVRATFPAGDIDQRAVIDCDQPDLVEVRAVPAPRPPEVWNAVANAADIDALPDSPWQRIGNDDLINPLTDEKVEGGQATGLAVWRLKVVKPTDGQINLLVRFKDGDAQRVLVHPFRAGGWKYEPPVVLHDDAGVLSTYVQERRAGFLNYIPGLRSFWVWWDRVSNLAPPAAALNFGGKLINFFWRWPIWLVSRITLLSAWIMAYLVLACALIPLLRKWMKVY